MVVAEIPDREALGNCEPWLFSPISCPLNRTGINLTREPPSRTASRGDSQSRTILGTAGVLIALAGLASLGEPTLRHIRRHRGANRSCLIGLQFGDWLTQPQHFCLYQRKYTVQWFKHGIALAGLLALIHACHS